MYVCSALSVSLGVISKANYVTNFQILIHFLESLLRMFVFLTGKLLRILTSYILKSMGDFTTAKIL